MNINEIEYVGASPLDDQELPGAAKFIAAILFINCIFTVGGTIADALAIAKASLTGENASLGLSTIVCTNIHMICISLTVICLATLAILLLRNKRRLSAITIYALYAIVGCDALMSFMLHGVTLRLFPYIASFAILIPVQSYLDPSLAEERRLQTRLRDAQVKTDQENGTLGLDKTGKGFAEINFFNLFWIFVVASIFGLVVETLYHYIIVVPGEWQDRAGLLFGPFSPIYGFGAVILTLMLNRFYKSHTITIFFFSAVIGGAFEVFVAYFMEYMYGGVAWNYSNEWLSLFGGRTCGKFMIMWGILGVFWLKHFLPYLIKTVNKIPWKWRYGLTVVCSVLMLADCIMTLQALDCWYMRLNNNPEEIEDTNISEFYDKYFDNDYMQHRFESMSINPDAAVRANK